MRYFSDSKQEGRLFFVNAERLGHDPYKGNVLKSESDWVRILVSHGCDRYCR